VVLLTRTLFITPLVSYHVAENAENDCARARVYNFEIQFEVSKLNNFIISFFKFSPIARRKAKD
jgi:hypothetical protein